MMATIFHTAEFQLARFIIDGLANFSDDERSEIFEGIRHMYCMFCGKRHPTGGMCTCWEGE